MVTPRQNSLHDSSEWRGNVVLHKFFFLIPESGGVFLLNKYQQFLKNFGFFNAQKFL